jgi:hypothetical protein
MKFEGEIYSDKPNFFDWSAVEKKGNSNDKAQTFKMSHDYLQKAE